mmetsp:Transcript_31820/g.103392  ORF Transcript_31820/g.103392 Transcript_31820/m.103392 type:complete len:157 (-) Transcript_31820:562-1032(-)
MKADGPRLDGAATSAGLNYPGTARPTIILIAAWLARGNWDPTCRTVLWPQYRKPTELHSISKNPQIGREGVALSTLETVSNLDGPPLSCGWLNIVSLRNQPNSPLFASLGASSISVAESGLLELSKKKSLTAHFVLIVLGGNNRERVSLGLRRGLR